MGPEVLAARVVVPSPAGPPAGHLRPDVGLARAAAMGAPVSVADPLMSRLAVPVTGDDLLEPFLDRLPRRPPGPLPQPRNLAFADGLAGWILGGRFQAGPTMAHWQDYAAAAADGTATLRSAVPQPTAMPSSARPSTPGATAAPPWPSAARCRWRTWPARPSCGCTSSPGAVTTAGRSIARRSPAATAGPAPRPLVHHVRRCRRARCRLEQHHDHYDHGKAGGAGQPPGSRPGDGRGGQHLGVGHDTRFLVRGNRWAGMVSSPARGAGPGSGGRAGGARVRRLAARAVTGFGPRGPGGGSTKLTGAAGER
jgi:hypothetical protein